MSRRRRLWALAALAALAVALGGVGGSAASLTAESDSPQTLAAVPDFVPPTVTAAIVNSAGGAAGLLLPGGTYYVYANVVDSGNPPSGVASATADVSAVTAGATAVPLQSGNFSAGGTTYNRRSALLTAKTPLPSGSLAFTVTATDVAGNARTESFSVTIDATAPRAVDVTTTNGGATPGQPEAGDTLSLVYSKALNPTSILAGWDGTATTVIVRIEKDGSTDVLTVWNAANNAQLPLGSVDLGRNDYTKAVVMFGTPGTPSRMTQAGTTLTITLGAPAGPTATAKAGAQLQWTPSTAATDLAGNPVLPTVALGSGGVRLAF